MELKAYARILWRWWWVILLVTVVAGVGSLVLRPQTPPSYTASLRFSVGLLPEDGGGRFYTYDQYYTWLTSEYLADDLSEVVRSQLFAEDVSRRLGNSVPAGVIQGATNPKKTHRILTVSITTSSAEQSIAIANAVAQALQEQGDRYFAQINARNASIRVIDPPALVPQAVGLRERLDLPLRLLLALAAGVALAFLLDYLDDSVRSASELEEMGLRVIGELPRQAGS